MWETIEECRSGEGEPESVMACETTEECRCGEVELLAAACDALRRSAFEFAVLDVPRVPIVLPVARYMTDLGPRLRYELWIGGRD